MSLIFGALLAICAFLISESSATTHYKNVFGCSLTEADAKRLAKNPIRNYIFGIVEKDEWTADDRYHFEIESKISGETVWESHKARAPVAPFEFQPGDYICKFSYLQTKYKTTFMHQWYLSVQSVAPFAMINGGSSRTIASNAVARISASESLKHYSNRYDNLKFAWSCAQKKFPNQFCNNGITMSNDIVIELPNILTNQEEITLTLEITGFDNKKSKTQQIVSVLDNAASITITCIKNCLPYKDFFEMSSQIILEASCHENCKGITYMWTITKNADTSFNFDYNTKTVDGRYNSVLKIKENALGRGDYIASVKANNRAGFAQFRLSNPAGPAVSRCYTLPWQGLIQFSIFQFYCEQSDTTKNYFYEIYSGSSSDGLLILSGYSPDVFLYEFSLNRNVHHTVRVLGISDNSYTEVPLNSSILEIPTKKTMQYVKGRLKETLAMPVANGKNFLSLINSDNFLEKHSGTQIFHTIMTDIVDFNVYDDNGKILMFLLKAQLVTNLFEFQADAVKKTLDLVDSVLNKMLSDNFDEAKRIANTVLMNDIAPKMAFMTVEDAKHFGYIKIDRITQQIGEVYINMSRHITQFLKDEQSTVYPQFDYSKLRIKLADACEIEEVDPDIIDMQIDQYKTLDELQDATENAVYLAITFAKIYALTFAKFKKHYETIFDSAAVTIAEDSCPAFAGWKYKTKNSEITLSQDFSKRLNEKCIILINNWDRDIYWWNNMMQSISADISNIEFWDSQIWKKTDSFDDPVTIKMDFRKKSQLTEILENNFSFPLRMSSDAAMNRFIAVRMFTVEPHMTLRVKFHHLNATDAFHIVVTSSKYPDIEDFKSSKVLINQNKTRYFHKFANHTRPFNAYIGILPASLERYANTVETIIAKFSLQYSLCVKWKLNDMIWIPDCEEDISVFDEEHIVCKCRSFSSISSILTIPIVKSAEVYEANFIVKIQVCYIIFYTVLGTFLVYSIFVNFAVFKKKEPFYFLADNIKAHKYAYLLYIRTNNAFHSGTTSKIAIKLIGSKSSSEPHVLNYPDPHLRLLQRFGEDTFVLTTERSLGDMKRIELWYNCIGSNPTWFVRDLIVYDLQERIQWYFFINKRFYILSQVTYMVATPLAEDQPTNETLLERFRCCGEFHSWFLFSNQEKFAYSKRITVVLSTVLTNYTLSLVIQGIPRLDLQDAFDSYSELQLDLKVVANAFMSSTVSFTVHIIVAWIFRHSRIQFSRRKQQTAPFSFKITLLLWGLIIANIVISTSILLTAGFWVPYYKSLEWVLAAFLSIAIEIFVYDNFVVIVHSFISKGKLVIDISSQYEVILQEIERQKKILYERFGNNLFRQQLTPIYTPLRSDQIAEKKIIVRQRTYIATQLFDIITFTIYFIFLLVMILNIRNPNTLDSKNAIIDMMNGKFTRTRSFESIETIYDIYDYMNETLLNVLHPKYWYGDVKMTISNDAVMMIDANNQFLGVVRIRQHRIKPEMCEVAKDLRFLFKSCYPEFSRRYQETGVFDYSWKNYSPSSYVNYDRWGKIWRYTPDKEAYSTTITGAFTTYPGGGYIAELGRIMRASYQRFRHYERKGWIDQRTRCVLIEMLTYSANSNMFNSVQLLYEQSATGFTTKTVSAQAARMIFGDNEQEKQTRVFFILYHLCVAVLGVKHFLRIIIGYKTFFKDYWFLMDFVITALNIATVIVFQIRETYISKFFRDLESSEYKSFINYFYLFELEDIINILTSFVLTIATLRLWQFLHFGLIFRIMERTLSIACVPLLAATLAFFIILLAFGHSGIILLGTEFKDFFTFLDTSRTLITMSLKPDQFDIRDFLIIKITYPYFSIYLILMQIILFVYIIIIIMAYMKAQMEFSVLETPYNIKDYVREQGKAFPFYVKGLLMRLTGGAPKRQVVLPKADEFRYANCLQIQISSLQKMKLITKCLLRNIRKSNRKVAAVSANDVVLMLQVCQNFVFSASEEDDKDLFFKGHFKGESVSLIDERRIMKIESVVTALLTKPSGSQVVQKRVTQKLSKVNEKIESCTLHIKKNQATLAKCDVKLRMLLLKLDTYTFDSQKKKFLCL